MKSIQKIIDAHVHNSEINDFNAVMVNINARYVARVMALQKALVSVGATYIQEVVEPDGYLKENKNNKLIAVNACVEGTRLTVSNTDFWYEGLIEETDVLWDTAPTSIEEIEVLFIPANKLLEYVGRTWESEEAATIFKKRLAKEAQ